jgi:hypothetical protein
MNLNEFITHIGEYMVRKFKPRGQNSQLENMRVHLIPSEKTESHSLEKEKELVELLAKFVQLGRLSSRKKKIKELSYAA